MSTDAQTPADPNSPLMKAWDAYKATDDFQNSKDWAMRVAPILPGGIPEQMQRRAVCDLMPFSQRERHVDGSLWAAFSAGFTAGQEGEGK